MAVAATARSFLDLAPLHEDVVASIRPTVAAAAVSGTSVRRSCRNFGTSIIIVMLSFRVGRLSCTFDQSNSEVFSIPYARTCVPWCQCCHVQMNAPVSQHIRELRETVNALVGASCGHVVPGAYVSLLDLWKGQRFAVHKMA